MNKKPKEVRHGWTPYNPAEHRSADERVIEIQKGIWYLRPRNKHSSPRPAGPFKTLDSKQVYYTYNTLQNGQWSPMLLTILPEEYRQKIAAQDKQDESIPLEIRQLMAEAA